MHSQTNNNGKTQNKKQLECICEAMTVNNIYSHPIFKQLKIPDYRFLTIDRIINLIIW